MSEAERVATLLAYEFLREGKFSAAHGPVEVRSLVVAAAAAEGNVEQGAVSEEAANFPSVAVQSVGFEEGPQNPAVHIYLTKGSAKTIKALPKLVEGVPVRAHKMGNVVVRPDAAASASNHGHLFEKNGRIACGSSCAPTSENLSGTLGALVRAAGSHQLYILSNNHVLAGCNHVPLDQPILSPSSADGKPSLRAPGEIARHERIHELRSGSPNFVNPCDADLALARATDPTILSSWQGDANGYDTPAASLEPKSGMRVKKFGRTTALTHGLVEARVIAPMPVGYTSSHFKGTVWFTNVWTVRGVNGAFALPGDSGSLVVSEDGAHSVGVVFAANPGGEYGWIIPMPCVLQSFGGLRLVSNHGAAP